MLNFQLFYTPTISNVPFHSQIHPCIKSIVSCQVRNSECLLIEQSTHFGRDQACFNFTCSLGYIIHFLRMRCHMKEKIMNFYVTFFFFQNDYVYSIVSCQVRKNEWLLIQLFAHLGINRACFHFTCSLANIIHCLCMRCHIKEKIMNFYVIFFFFSKYLCLFPKNSPKVAICACK